MSRSRFTDHGFAQIRRGLREHLFRMSSDAVKLYIWLHLVARWTGKKRGTIETNYAEIAKELRFSETRVKRAMSELHGRYIKFVGRGNQYRSSVIQILKYRKKSKRAQATGDPSKTVQVTGDHYTDQSTDQSTSEIAAAGAGFRSPNKAVEGSISKAAAAAVWTFLGIEPCGHPKFCQLLESCWDSRNGDLPSVVIGTCLDAWRDANGQDTTWNRGLAPLFRALTGLRKHERMAPAEADPLTDILVRPGEIPPLPASSNTWSRTELHALKANA